MNSVVYMGDRENDDILNVLSSDTKNLEISDVFYSAEILLDFLREDEEKIDIIFLDIDKNEDDIFTLVEKLLKLSPEFNFVFMISKNHDFLEILQNKELFYLLKPISAADLKVVIEKVRKEKQSVGSLTELYIETQGDIRIYDVDRNKLNINWPDSKTKELFAFLLHHKGEFVSRDKIIEKLWGANDNKNFRILFFSTLLKLRKIFSQYGFDNLIEANLTAYRISLKRIEVDFIKIEILLKKSITNKYRVYKLLNLLKGSYLAADNFDWCKEYRKEFEKRIKKELNHAAEYFMSVGQNTITKNILTTLINIGVVDESVYDKLINIYKRECNNEKAEQLLKELDNISKEELASII
ncbi:SARP family transcriptional regulator [Halanaerobium hydrogeniformans]|uniref:Response regulator receiver and SARP domain protein n=1 Tax=Halanaerobium hydrogeniformans TaxID=656519 RepID=E4RPT6_HALHG|nr:SARP family transcriptional regulator [Halanaerobium hydrogeniformans]ADQ13970.1 response regulator receiver and SARP domain protein [Halanaerobium hydrogeniformans]